MLRLIGRRLLLMVPTLILASMLIFALAEVLPGDVGRSILGPYATQEQVNILNHQLGADRPLYERYVTLGRQLRHRRLGRVAAAQQIPVVPDGHEGARQLAASSPASRWSSSCPRRSCSASSRAYDRDSVLDRTITVSTLSMTVIPEFVSGVVLI